MNDAARIEAIRGMTPEQVLHMWRFEPAGSPWVVGEVGHALSTRYKEIRGKLSDEEWSNLSKQVGWEKK